MPNRRIECGKCHAKGFIAGKECTTCDGAGYWNIASPRCATCDTDIQWTDGAECDECDEWYCDNHLTEDGECKVCGNTSLSFHAEGANPSGGSTGNQIVSWESGGLSSPSGPPSDIFWSEGDDGKLYCDRCDNLADFNFQDIDVRWDIEDGEFTGNHEMRNHLGSYNDFLCRACAEDEGFAAEMGRGSKWSEADAAHALLRRKSKKQRTIDRKKARRQKYSAEGERIRNAGELVDYVDVVMNGKVFIEKPFTLPPYLEELMSQDKAEIMTSQDEMDILFRDGSMASCIYDARNNTLNTFVVAYGGDEEYNSETIDSQDWDKTEYEKKDLEIVKPFGTAMKATMGVAAGTAAILGIMVALTKLGGNNE